MDRQSTLGFILIFLLLVTWMMINAPQEEQNVPSKTAQKTQTTDTSKIKQQKAEKKELVEKQEKSPYGKFFSDRAMGKERIITVETDYFKAELSTKGAVIKTWELKKYKTWNGFPVQLVDYDNKGDLSILLTTTDGKVINTKELFFDVQTPINYIKLENNFEFEIIFILPSSNGGQLLKKMKFANNTYGFDAEIQFVNLQSVIANYQYELAWEHGVRFAEYNSVDEASFAAGYAFAGNELAEINAASVDEKVKKELTGVIDWVATCNKYFAVALIPINRNSEGAHIAGFNKALKDHGMMETYSIALTIPYKGEYNEKSEFKVFLGPMQMEVLESYNVGLEKIMSLGWAWIIRPISEYILLPLFTAIHYVVPNWGLVIIIFSILIKISLHPLSKSQMKSMKKMQKLQPMMNEIREKYKNDPQKMNKSIMNLYKEYGVNPAGSCLPLLLQLPIMFALYNVLRGAIELRQANFIWWITDLSAPDVMFKLPFALPLIGIQEISGIALLMGITMFFQTKMTTTDPRQKALIYIMPIMMTLLFNGFPSGLNLYYAVFNILAIGQQYFVNKKHDDEPLRKVEPKKKAKGGIFKLAKDMPRFKK